MKPLRDGPQVVVIGAGTVGLHVAEQFAYAGCAVTLLDGATHAQSTATHVAAGMLAPYAEALRAPPINPAALELGKHALWLWEQRWGAGGPFQNYPFFLRSSGALMIAQDEAQMARLKTHAQTIADAGAYTQLLSAQEARERAPLSKVYGALAISEEAVVDVAMAYAALMTAYIDRGSLVRATAEEIEVTCGRVSGVIYDGGRLAADAVVLACGAFASDALIRAAPALRHVTPAAGQRLLLRHETNAPADFPNLHADDCYIAKVSTNAVIVGATTRVESDDVSISESESESLEASARLIAPSVFAGAKVSAAAGVRPMSPDGAPLIGPNGPKGCFIAAGHGRNGWLLAPVTADIIGDYVFEREVNPLAASFHPDRFETIP